MIPHTLLFLKLQKMDPDQYFFSLPVRVNVAPGIDPPTIYYIPIKPLLDGKFEVRLFTKPNGNNFMAIQSTRDAQLKFPDKKHLLESLTDKDMETLYAHAFHLAMKVPPKEREFMEVMFSDILYREGGYVTYLG